MTGRTCMWCERPADHAHCAGACGKPTWDCSCGRSRPIAAIATIRCPTCGQTHSAALPCVADETGETDE